jgi:hypothetical protein
MNRMQSARVVSLLVAAAPLAACSGVDGSLGQLARNQRGASASEAVAKEPEAATTHDVTIPCYVGGFDFDGPQLVPVAPQNMACPRILTAEESACFDVGGRPLLAAGCRPLCNLPISKQGRIAGFTFGGYVERPALPAGGSCVVNATQELLACARVGGWARKDSQCGDVCSHPIAHAGDVSGYSFTAFVTALAPEPGSSCLASASPELIACDASGGVSQKSADCRDLCSAPIAPVCP